MTSQPPSDSGDPVALFKRAEAVFAEVAGLSPGDRADRIASLCSGDEPLRRAVSALIASSDHVGGFLEEPVLGRAFDQLKREVDTDEVRDDLIGVALGPFRLDGRIASGGMGTVYLATRIDEQFQQRVAIKVVKRGMDSEEILRRFREERQTLAQLDHPNIARLLDAGATPDGRPYLVMEYVDGVPIDKYCDRQRLSIPDRLRLFRLVCEGVHAAHQSLVIHRDIKPSNILVTAGGVPKLLDFGIAKVLTGTGGVQQTIESERRLTPEYASPEQVDGGPITTASDVYSLGVVLYELLTGTRPYSFSHRSTQEIRRVVCGSMPVPPSEAITRRAGAKRGVTVTPALGSTALPTGPTIAGGELPAQADHPQTHRVSSTRLRGQLRGDLDTIVMMALRKEPPRRYASAEQMAADIGRYLTGMPVSARRDTWFYRTRKFTRRHAPAVVAVVIAVALLITSLIVRTQQRNQIAAQRDELAAANRRLDETRRLLVQMLSGAQTSGKGPSATLGEVLQDAASGLEASPPADDLTLASVREAVGAAMMTLGMTEKARPLLESAEARFKSLPPDSDARLGIETELAQLLVYEGKPAEAEAPLRDLLKRERAANGGTPTARECDILNAIGSVLRLTGRLDEAMTTQQQALSLRKAVHGEASLPVAESLNNIATIHFSAGRFTEAVSFYQDSLKIRAAKLRADHPMILNTDLNLGLSLSRAGDNDKAIPLLQRAVDGWPASFGPEHPGVVAARTSLGQALRKAGRYDESIAAFEQASQWQRAHAATTPAALLATRVNIAVTRAERVKADGSGCAQAAGDLEAVRADAAYDKLSPGLRKQADEGLVAVYERCGRAADAEALRQKIKAASTPTPAGK